jgi:hypothetical protein
MNIYYYILHCKMSEFQTEWDLAAIPAINELDYKYAPSGKYEQIDTGIWGNSSKTITDYFYSIFDEFHNKDATISSLDAYIKGYKRWIEEEEKEKEKKVEDSIIIEKQQFRQFWDDSFKNFILSELHNQYSANDVLDTSYNISCIKFDKLISKKRETFMFESMLRVANINSELDILRNKVICYIDFWERNNKPIQEEKDIRRSWITRNGTRIAIRIPKNKRPAINKL